ncbi:MAG: hypothetical protein JZU60_00150 [Ilumatobacteraceae bacterium]|jgi:type IV pilus assembly protein PilX|nr:hypothetical protein [Ilumatobacteraceae bacterium]
MPHNTNPCNAGRVPPQKGAALIVSLILLIIMTLIGLAGIRGITQQERMANHSFDRSLAFQSTEATLREIESLVEAKKPKPAPGSGCAVVDGLMSCETPANDATPRWDDTAFTSWTNATVVGSGTHAVTPQYFVEYLGDQFECAPGIGIASGEYCWRYRITARSNDGDGSRSYVMLQSTYATEPP